VKIEGPGKLLRIFIGESDRWQGGSLAEAIVLMLREEGLAGATVVRGIEGFGADSRIHTAHILQLSEDLPMVIEVVDREERIQKILPKLEEMIAEGLVCMADVDIVMYRHSGPKD
jgi:PII-like signaling protein